MLKNKLDLEKEINRDEKVTKLEGIYKISLENIKNYFIGGKYLGAGILVTLGEKIIDGSNAQIVFELFENSGSFTTLFCILKNVKSVVFQNLNVKILYAGNPSDEHLCCFMNYSFKCSIINCQINFKSEKQINYTAIYNDGCIDTTLQSSADNFVVTGNCIEAITISDEVSLNCRMCGIENHFANSVNISNNYIFVKNRGEGKGQIAYGIINSGKYARIENNNIKANGSHSQGKQMEAAYACGMLNESRGEYLVFHGNNCVGEWGGMCVGLRNLAAYSTISGNKILSTHTIKGRTVVLEGIGCVLSGNIITSTSRNPHLVEIYSDQNIVSENYIRGLMGMANSISGVGIWVEGRIETKSVVKYCNIIGNVISGIRDCGIVLRNTENNNISNNKYIQFYDLSNYMPVLEINSKKNKFENNALPKESNIDDPIFLQNSDQAIYSLE